MSYQDLTKSGARELSSLSQQGTRHVENLLLKLTNNVAQLDRLVDVLGTAKDTVDHRHKLAAANRGIQDLAKDVKAQLTGLVEQGGQASTADSQKGKKLLQDFATILQNYKRTQKIAAEREAVSLPKPNPKPVIATKAGLHGDGQQSEGEIEKQALLQQQRQEEVQRLDNAIQYNEALIEERDQGIAEIQQQIGEVNEMFQDLAVLINDQGAQVILIDDQITATAERVKEGRAELTKASRSQRALRNKCLWLWLIAAIVVAIILIVTLA